MIRVMSFNIRCSTATGDGPNHWSKRREICFRTIERFDPDLLGLQEVISDQADELAARFKATHTFIGVGREDGKRQGEFAPILFRTDRFGLVDHGHIWLSETPGVPGSVSWDSALTRMATWVKLRDREQQFIFLNTHFDHIGEVARLESARLLRNRLADLCDSGKLAMIFTGDLNCTEDDAPLPALLCGDDRLPALTDAYRETHPARDVNEQSFHGFRGGTEGSRIDFILHTPQFRTMECEIDHSNENGRYPSDHFAIEAVFDLK